MYYVTKRTVNIITVLLITIALLMESVPTVNAYNISDKEELSMCQIDSDTLRICDSNESLTVRQTGNKITIHNETTGDTDILEMRSEGLYSSFTGKIIPMDELQEMFGEDLTKTESASLLKTGFTSQTKTKKISYNKIRTVVGASAGIAVIASGVAGLLALAYSIDVAAVTSCVATILSGIGGVVTAVMNGSKKHGLKITLKSYQQNVKGTLMERWKVTKITKY